ncbi:hypothetical protein [Limosilactobacillus caecicola]|uniref:hypothetical protein n=1 Tax=Limosilactobacillus caecicola TaxID=2941332 RepID=UPI00203F6A44|nr:hypothetical protein [Limosilactobacillus caecicola]
MKPSKQLWQAAKQVGTACHELQQNLQKLQERQHDTIKVTHALQRRWIRYNYANQPHYERLQKIFTKMSK